MAGLTPQPRLRFFDDITGAPLEGGYVYTYAANSLIPQDTYTDQSGNTANPNPVPLDSDGGASIWFNGAYKIDVKKSLGGTSLTGYPVDNINIYDLLDWSQLTATIADLNATDTSTVSVNTTTTIILSQRGKTILCDATSASFTINLLAAATATNGYEITFKKTDVSTNLVTLDGANSETIEGRSTFILYDQNDVVTLLCDGNNWRVKSAVIRGNTQIISTAYTVTIADINKTFICSANAPYAVTLLSAATAGDGFKITFKKSSDLNDVTLTPAGAETIDEFSSLTLTNPYQCITLESNGINWLILNEARISNTTGDIKVTFNPDWGDANSGWVYMNDGSIGSAASAATTRANNDTQNLFVLLWNNVADAYAPVSGGRGASAIADFNANKTLTLPASLGRALGVAGAGGGLTSRALGQPVGEETHVLTVPEIPSHAHDYITPSVGVGAGSPAGSNALTTGTTGATGGGGAHNNMQPTVFMYIFIKL